MWFFHLPKRRSKHVPEKKYDVMAEVVRPKGATRPAHQRADGPGADVLRRMRVDRALQAFLSAENWDATHAALKQEQQLLLTDEAISVLREFIQQVRAQDHPNAQGMAAYLDAHRLLLERARAIGVEPAWREFRALRLEGADNAASMPTYDAETQAIIDALKRLLATENWNDTYTILVSERERLCTDTADQFLSALIQVAEQDDTPHAQEGLRYLQLHRTLLREMRTLGLEAAWANFDRTRRAFEAEIMQNSPPPDPDSEVATVARALRNLLATNNWAEVRQILERDQALLLSDISDRLLEELLVSARRDDDPRALRGIVYLGLQRRLLRRARVVGIDQAWREFEAAMAEATGRAELPTTPLPPLDGASAPNESAISAKDMRPADVAEAVEAFLAAPSWERAHEILRDRRRALLTDTAIAMLHDKAEALLRRGTGRDLYAAHLLDLQATLLRRARAVGIEQAWQEFEAERD
jgi:hypothetical protein